MLSNYSRLMKLFPTEESKETREALNEFLTNNWNEKMKRAMITNPQDFEKYAHVVSYCRKNDIIYNDAEI